MLVTASEILSIKIKTIFEGDTFIVQQAVVEEALSEPYVIDVYAYTTLSTFDADELIYTKAAIVFEVYGVRSSSKVEIRAYHGIITHIEHLKTIIDERRQLSHFLHFQIRPHFWMLKYSKDYRIFQEKSAIAIVQRIFSENDLSDFEVQVEGLRTREYCVQYGESYYDFVSRLLEEEGIGYYFVHTDSTHTMILFDKNSSFTSITQETLPFLNADTGEALVNHVLTFGKKLQVSAKSYKIVDYNYTMPNVQLLNNSHGEGFGREIYEYPGLFQHPSRGEQLADQRMEEIEWLTKRVYGKSSCASLAAGKTFTLQEHPITAYNASYAISYVRHEITTKLSDDKSEGQAFSHTYINSFEGFLKTIPYRPHRKTEKPRIYGSQTAFVTGAGTEVYSDSLARIKIKFHWDLKNSSDETSSLWVRMSQSLSGASWGSLYMPRIGMEVVVSFIDGDPDRPLVTGCVYNQAFMPPYSPKDLPHYMTLKSKTFDAESGSNELRFSDKPGAEEIYIHGQHDMNTVIEHSRTESIKEGDDSLIIDKGNKLLHQKGEGTMFLTLIDNGHHTTNLKKGNFVIDVNGTIFIRADKAITITSPDNITLTSEGDVTLKASKNIIMEAGQTIQSKEGKD